MASQSQREWLDPGDDDLSEDHGYDSEAMEDSRAGRARKRRRRTSPDESEQSDDEEEQQENASQSKRTGPTEAAIAHRKNSPSVPTHLNTAAQISSSRRVKSARNPSKPVSKSGVIYISRIPPFMKPGAIKNLLSPYGSVNRVFLTPEDPSSHTRRVKSGGNKKRSFTDGWVEFEHKRDAKNVAKTLNTQIIGGKKGGWYHDDIWNIKYLKGFKWHHLTEQIASENAERAARLRTEISQTAKENKRFTMNVEKAKMLEGMKSKKTLRTYEDSTDVQDGAGLPTGKEATGVVRHFRQNEVKRKGQQVGDIKQREDVQRVLDKIF